jgi:TOBE domain
MRHPKNRSGVTRRQLLRGAAVAAAGTGVAGALAACQNTTTPIGFCEDSGTEAGGSGDGASAGGAGGGLVSSLVVAKPVGPGGLPLPRNDNSVEWAITDDNPMLADGVAPDGGTLRIYNYADYIDPGSSRNAGRSSTARSSRGTYEYADEAIAKLTSGATDGENRLPGLVEHVVFLGSFRELRVRIVGGALVKVITPNDGAAHAVEQGAAVTLHLPLDSIRCSLRRSDGRLGAVSARFSDACGTGPASASINSLRRAARLSGARAG